MSEKPNVLLLLTDQQRYDTIAAAGFEHMKTPNMDRLVHEGCLFANAYTPNPVCVPARHYLLTGTTARFHGYYVNQGTPIKDDALPMLPRALSDNGYATAVIGKTHFAPRRRHHGFDDLYLMDEVPLHVDDDEYMMHLKDAGYGDARNIHGVRPHIYNVPQKSVLPEKLHGTNWIADKAIEYIDQKKDRPFFLQCGWIAPHPPWNIPERLLDLYDDVDVPESVEVSRSFPYHSGTDCEWYGDNDSPETKAQIRRAYYTAVTMIDTAIGRILDCLEQNGLLDNTLIILTSDHGDMLQDKGFYGKEVPYEGAARIPLVMRYPKTFAAGSADRRFADLCDVFPTILDVTGVDLHYKEANKRYELFGESLLKNDSPRRDRDYQWCEYGKDAPYGPGNLRWVAMRDERYKFIYYYNGGTEQFYDLQDDPGETRNLIGSEDLPQEAYARLRSKCLEMEVRWGVEEYVQNGDFRKFESHEFPKERTSKFPGFANYQFMRFGRKPSQQEAEIFVREMLESIEYHNDPDLLKNLFRNEDWLDEFREQFIKFGGDEEGLNRIFGKD